MPAYQGLPEGAEIQQTTYVGLPTGAEILPTSSLLSETLKAPARVVGGIAKEVGEATQYVTGDRAGTSLRNWGQGVEDRNAITPSFRQAHPIISTAGDVVEGAAKMVPYLAGDAALSLVAPEVGVPAAVGVVAKGLRAASRAPLSTVALPAVMGASQGERSYEKGVANGLTPEQALEASLAPAAVTGVGMAAMGGLSHGLQGLGGTADTLTGQFVKHAAADTSIMMAQGVATTAAEKATGIDPNAQPLDQLKDPKAWLSAALTGGMFAGLGVAGKAATARALKLHLDDMQNLPAEEQRPLAAELATQVHPDDPAAAATLHAEVLDRLDAGDHPLDERTQQALDEITRPEELEATKADLTASLEEFAAGRTEDPLEAFNAKQDESVTDVLRPVRQDLVAPEITDPALLRAQTWAKDGRVVLKEGLAPDAEVAAHLDDMGLKLTPGERVDRKAGGSVKRREWLIEPKDEVLQDTFAEPIEPPPALSIQDLEQRPAYDGDTRNVVVRKGDQIGLIDQAYRDPMTGEVGRKMLAKAEIVDGKLGEWSEGHEPETPEERIQTEALFRRHLGEGARLNRVAKITPEQVMDHFEFDHELEPSEQRKVAKELAEYVNSLPEEIVVYRAVSAKELAAVETGEDIGEHWTPSKDTALQFASDNGLDKVFVIKGRVKKGDVDLVRSAALNSIFPDENELFVPYNGKQTVTGVHVLSRREAKNDPSFNRVTAHAGTPKADIDAHLKDIIAKLKLPVEVVNNALEIPGLRPDTPAFDGAFHQGKIYLNAEHVSSVAEAERVLLKHELAHAGLMGTLGKDGLNTVLGKAWGDLNSGVREFAELKGIGVKDKAGKLEATEEYLVHLAETGADHPLWDKFVAAFKAAMRKLGFDLKYSDAEMRSLVLDATKSMTTGEGDTRFSRLFRGDSIHADGVGEGTVGDLGKGYYFAEDHHVAEAFTDGPDPSHTRAFDVGIEKPFDMMGRGHAADPRWKEMLAGAPTDKDRLLLGRWAKGYLDLKNPYQFLASSFGQTVETFNDFLAKHGYDGVVTQGVRGVSDSGTQYVAFGKGQVLATRLSRATTLDAQKKATDELVNYTSTQIAKRALSDISGNIWRAIMPIDRTIKMSNSMKEYVPIKEHLNTYMVLKRAKAAAGDVPTTHAQTIRLEHEKAFKTDAAHKVYDDLTTKATLYELHADPSMVLPWTEKSWIDAGKDKQTGKTLGEARSEVKKLWDALTPEQQKVQQKTIEHMKVLSEQFREAQLEPLRASFGDETFNAAEVVSKDLWNLDSDGIGKLYETHGAEIVELATQIAEINSERGQLKGDYAPLMRFGDHVVRTMEEGSESRLKTEVFESKQKALDAVERIKLEAGVYPEYSVQTEGERNVTNIPLAFLEKMKAAAESRGLSGEALDALMDDFKAARVQTMPRTSLAGNGLHREGVEGYSTDALRSYASYVAKSSRAIASLKYGTSIEQTFSDMNNSIKAYQDPARQWDAHAVERMSTLKDSLYKLEMQHNSEKINEFTKGIGKATFLWYLSSPSVWAVQWSQPFITTIPKMAARYGFGESFTSYVKEAKNYTAGRFSDEKIEAFNAGHENAGERLYSLIQEERRALPAEKAALRASMRVLYDGFGEGDKKLLVLKVLGLQGALDLSSSHALQDLISGASDGQKLMNDVVSKGAFFMQKSETGSRRAAAVSSFQLALAHGKDFMEANDYASNIIDDTLADFSSQNRPGIMRGNTGRVLGQFQFFRLHMLGKTVQLAKDAYGAGHAGKLAALDAQRAQHAEIFGQVEADRVHAEGVQALNAERSESRKELAYMTGMSMGLAGAAGTPLAMLASNMVTDTIWAGLQMAFGDPDDPWDPKQDFENAVKDAAGDTAGNAFLKGLPSLFGMDVSKRIGLGGMANAISGDPPPGLTGTQKAQWYAGRILGPSFGMVSDSMRAVDAVSNGDYSQAVAVSSPKVLKDFIKAYSLNEKGAVGGGGNVMIQPEDISPASIALQLLGVNPMEVALAQEERREISGLSVTLRDRRNLLMKRVTEATISGDMDAREEALQGVNTWGQKQPALKITQTELLNALKRGRDAAAGKLSKHDVLMQGMVKGVQ